MTHRHAVATLGVAPKFGNAPAAPDARATANLAALVESVARAFPQHGLPPLPPDRLLSLYRALSPFVDGADGALPPEPRAGECPRCRRADRLNARTVRRRRRWRRDEERTVWECGCGWAGSAGVR